MFKKTYVCLKFLTLYIVFSGLKNKKSSLDLIFLGVSLGEFLSRDYAPFLLFFICFVVSCLILASLSTLLGTKSKAAFKSIQTFVEGGQDTIFMVTCVTIFCFLTNLYSFREALIGGAIICGLTKLLLMAESKNSKVFEFLVVGVFLVRLALNRVDLHFAGYFLVAGFLFLVFLQFKSSEPVKVFVAEMQESQTILKAHKKEAFFLLTAVEKVATLLILQSVALPFSYSVVSSFLGVLYGYAWAFFIAACLANVLVVNVFNAPTKATMMAIQTCASCVGAGAGGSERVPRLRRPGDKSL